MFKIRIADLNIGMDNKYPYIKRLCEKYIIDNSVETDFDVSVTKEEIDYEEKGDNYGVECNEAVALYRKISEKILEYDGFLLHGVILKVNDRGIGFGAQSGTGKSTHAMYWQKMLGEKCVIVNGDKPLMRIKDGAVYAYGTPWCGKEGISTNTIVKMTDFCIVNRGETNSVSEVMSEKDSFKKLLYSVYLPRGNDKLFQKTMSLMEEFVRCVKVRNIYCNMSIEAAETVYKAIFGENTQ